MKILIKSLICFVLLFLVLGCESEQEKKDKALKENLNTTVDSSKWLK